MTNNPLRKLDTPLAQELADLLLHQHDLKSSMAALRLWQEKYAEQDSATEAGIIGKSLFRDSIVQFVGCFDKGAKFRLAADEIYKSADDLALFQWFQDVRDSYAAHKFGAQRQCVVGVVWHPQHGVGAGNLMATYKGQLRSDGPMLITLMQTAETFLDRKVERLRGELLESAQKMTREEIEALPLAQTHTLAPNEARMSRRKLQSVRSSGASADQLSWTMGVPDESKTHTITSHSPKKGEEKS
jgi:hypothetical protein